MMTVTLAGAPAAPAMAASSTPVAGPLRYEFH